MKPDSQDPPVGTQAAEGGRRECSEARTGILWEEEGAQVSPASPNQALTLRTLRAK